jgi:actin-related protein
VSLLTTSGQAYSAQPACNFNDPRQQQNCLNQEQARQQQLQIQQQTQQRAQEQARQQQLQKQQQTQQRAQEQARQQQLQKQQQAQQHAQEQARQQQLQKQQQTQQRAQEQARQQQLQKQQQAQQHVQEQARQQQLQKQQQTQQRAQEQPKTQSQSPQRASNQTQPRANAAAPTANALANPIVTGGAQPIAPTATQTIVPAGAGGAGKPATASSPVNPFAAKGAQPIAPAAMQTSVPAGAAGAGKPSTAASPVNPFAARGAQPIASAAMQTSVPAGAGAAGAGKPSTTTSSVNPFAAGGAQTRPPVDAASKSSLTPYSTPPLYKPGPNVKTTALANGMMTHVNPSTRTSVSTDAGGRIMVIEKPGLKATAFRSDGRAAHIERARADGSKMIVERGLRGERRIEVVRPSGVRVVTIGRRGFVEHPLRRGYVARTYVAGGRSEVRVYRTTVYRNIQIRSYVPAVVYLPAFYGWASRPWREPVTYVWVQTPSSGVYEEFFTPERSYPSASIWVVDFMMAENLRLAYEAQMAGGERMAYQERPSIGAPVTRQVKDMLAEQVRQQIEVEQLAATQPAAPMATNAAAEVPPAALDPRYRVFVAHTNLAMTSSTDGQICTLTPGDVIQRTSNTLTDDGKVGVMVLSSKGTGCPVSFQSAIDLATLQDMHNQFRENISAGLGKLASSAGSGGIPVAPATNPKPLPEGQAQADGQARNLLLAQFKEADQAEEEVKLASDSAI